MAVYCKIPPPSPISGMSALYDLQAYVDFMGHLVEYFVDTLPSTVNLSSHNSFFHFQGKVAAKFEEEELRKAKET